MVQYGHVDLNVKRNGKLLTLVITSALIEPGQTWGDSNQPFCAREGTKNQKEHWEGTPVLELVDLNERGRAVNSGAPKALQAFAALHEQQ